MIESTKRYLKLLSAAALTAAVMSGCSDDKGDFPQYPDAAGKPVNFTLSTKAESRTYYANSSWNENATTADIFWGNPWDNNSDEKVVIYGNYAGNNKGVYTVSGYNTPDTTGATGGKNATTLTLNSSITPAGVQWGAQPAEGSTGKVTFFSVYPAYNGEYLKDSAPENGWIQTAIPGYQTPVKYRTSDNSALSPTNATSAARTIYCEPDMRGAVMIAKTEVDYNAEQVPLEYNVITNVIDLTINGPIKGTPNYLDIQTVRIVNTKGNPIGGVFNYDVMSNHDNSTKIYYSNGNSNIQLQLGEVPEGSAVGTAVNFPRLYNHGATADQLRLRAFVGPYVAPSELSIEIETADGRLFKVAAGKLTQSFENGKIHRIKLPMLDVDQATKFEFDHWMDQINENVYLTELSIPGSWEAFNTAYQPHNYLDQYNAGIRAFAITPTSSDSPTATVNVGKTTLAEVLKNLGERLVGKKEFVILQLRGIGNAQSIFNTYVNPDALKKTLRASKYVYGSQATDKEIDKNLTLGDVYGRIIVKCNADGNNGLPTALDTQSPFPALFSKWAKGTADKVSTTALYWGMWNPDVLTVGNTGLKWCYSEADAITDRPLSGNQATFANRESAIQNYATESANLYNKDAHDTWFYLLVGGYSGSQNAEGTGKVAERLNTYCYNMLADPARKKCPMGIVMMNQTTSTNAAYNSANLIRLLINNNGAFELNTKPGTTTQADHDGTYSNGGTFSK